MTRLSDYFLPTEKLPPADAEALSHKLMVRAGLIRQVGAGLWSYLPAGWRVQRKIEQIIREEMDLAGALEMQMPILQPIEPWQKTGRAEIEELFKLKDRRGTELVLAMTHEENVTLHVAQVVRSYRELPLVLYQIQTKERDEPRPRAGVLRTREFTMKDAYSFDRDSEGLDRNYEEQITAYDRIFDRCGIEWYRVQSDVGMMGGTDAHEYMAPCAAGENEVVLANGYAANIEVATADARPAELPEGITKPEETQTPGLVSVDEVSAAFGVSPSALLKAYPVVGGERGLQLVLLRGDHRVNEVKLRNYLGEHFRPAHPEEISERIGPVGFIGPVGIDVPIVLDTAVAAGGYVCGANRADYHLRGATPGRDFQFESADIRLVEEGDTVNGSPLRIETAIEVGNIFKLGTRYSEPLGATYLDESGSERLIWMGSYGIGPARIAAAAVEQFADEAGISWPRAIAPFDLELVTLGKTDTPERTVSDQLYGELCERGLDVLYDDRDAGPGEKFADAELLGCPLRLTVGKRSLESGELEVQQRRGQQQLTVPLASASESVAKLWQKAP